MFYWSLPSMNQSANPISYKVPVILVMTSAKKKSLNLTLPNGALKISKIVYTNAYLACLYPHFKQG